jgi:hypothetical protein
MEPDADGFRRVGGEIWLTVDTNYLKYPNPGDNMAMEMPRAQSAEGRE